MNDKKMTFFYDAVRVERKEYNANNVINQILSYVQKTIAKILLFRDIEKWKCDIEYMFVTLHWCVHYERGIIVFFFFLTSDFNPYIIIFSRQSSMYKSCIENIIHCYSTKVTVL